MIGKPVYAAVALPTFKCYWLAAVVSLLFFYAVASILGCPVVQLVWPFPYGNAADLTKSRIFGWMIDQVAKRFEASVHGPMANIGAVDEKSRQENAKQVLESIEFALKHGVNLVSLHLADSDWSYSQWLGRPIREATVANVEGSLESFSFIIEALGHREYFIAIENLTQPAFQVIESFAQLFGAKVGLTLDIAHAVSQGLDPVALIHKYRDSLKIVHLSTTIVNLGQINGLVKHCAYDKTGAYDLTAVLEALIETGFEGQVIMEVDLWDFWPSQRWLNKTLKTLYRQHGIA